MLGAYLGGADESEFEDLHDLALGEEGELGIEAVGPISALQSADHELCESVHAFDVHGFRMAACDKLQEHHAETEHIALGRDARAGARELRRRVHAGPLPGVRVQNGQKLHHPEVADLGLEAVVQEDVRGGEVQMQHRGSQVVVQVREPARHADGDSKPARPD